VLFGDGAGAVLLSASDGPGGLMSVELYSDGNGELGIIIPGGGTAHPATAETVQDRLHYMRMAGKEVYRYATRQLAETTQAAVSSAGLRMTDIDLFLYHQANLRILETVRDLLGIPADKVYVNLDRYGNTSAASVPMALAEAVAAGRVNVGDRILMGAFGAGYTAGAAVLEWTADPTRAFLAPGEQTRAGQPRREPVGAGVD
jgi:3-oxoacyl-[acyl-carrier-protein] synthase-3